MPFLFSHATQDMSPRVGPEFMGQCTSDLTTQRGSGPRPLEATDRKETTVADDRSKHMTGLFRDREAAERAYGCLTNHGYAGSDVSLLMTDETRQRCFPRTEESTTELGSKAARGQE